MGGETRSCVVGGNLNAAMVLVGIGEDASIYEGGKVGGCSLYPHRPCLLIMRTVNYLSS